MHRGIWKPRGAVRERRTLCSFLGKAKWGRKAKASEFALGRPEFKISTLWSDSAVLNGGLASWRFTSFKSIAAFF
jgi:hypothetical protein